MRSLWNDWSNVEVLARKIATKALADFPTCTTYQVDDLVAESKIIFIRCRTRWEPNRGPLENYFSRSLRFELRKLLLRESRRRKREIPADPSMEPGSPDRRLELVHVAATLDHIGALEPVGTFALIRELSGPPISLRARTICMEIALGVRLSKSVLHRARTRAARLMLLPSRTV